ncbi:MAG: formate/nitrite transporter family protein [Deltaproteobacteria bacterium]|jgi:formate/nitrite transporter|nr:formate/nitrite transporter family protein [Deltaproteobacteria bacterium]
MLTPKEIALTASDIGVKKAGLGSLQMLILGILAGAFIAFASEGSSMAAFNWLSSPATFGLGRFIAGLVFPTGLMLVVIAGGELFTGNMLMCIALAQGRITLSAMLKNWFIVYAGNLIGSLFLAWMMSESELFNSGANLLGGVTIAIAAGKVSHSFMACVYLGIMCNWLVCLAVWLAYSATSLPGKILGIFCPIWLFITSGFEHCVANMYYIPAGILAKSNTAWAAASGLSQTALEQLSWHRFALANLVPVTLGNIVGGALFVAMAYWFVYLRTGKQS